jgi:DnaA family protein
MKQMVLDIGLPTGPTLANFCVGSNVAALDHLRLWLANLTQPVAGANVPTYYWGASGSGKSHLLKAAYMGLREQSLAVGWLDANVLAPPEYDENWSAVIMDDVHLYSPAQQHTAFNWFVNAQTHPCHILAAGQFAPVELALRDDLRTRLGWGHIFHLQPLSESESRAVLYQAADARGIFLSEEVMDFVLTRFRRDLESLMNLLVMIDGYSLQTKRSITIPMIKSMLEHV